MRLICLANRLPQICTGNSQPCLCPNDYWWGHSKSSSSYCFTKLDYPHGASFSFIVESDGSSLAKGLFKNIWDLCWKAQDFYLVPEILIAFCPSPYTNSHPFRSLPLSFGWLLWYKYKILIVIITVADVCWPPPICQPLFKEYFPCNTSFTLCGRGS